MDLDELKKQLYKENDGIGDRPQAPEVFRPGHEYHEYNEAPAQKPEWSSGDAKKFAWANWRRKIYWFMGSAVILVLAGFAVWLFVLGGISFDKKSVSVEIFGQERVIAGEEVSYIVRYRNNSKSNLNNVSIQLIYPEQSLPAGQQNILSEGGLTFISRAIGALAPGAEGEANFEFRVFGDKESQQNFSAKLIYRPPGYSSDFSNESSFVSKIISVPLVLHFGNIPERAVSGQVLSFSLKYLNTSDVAFDESKLKLEYPEGFVFDSALPPPDEGNNIWSLPEISSNEEGKIMVKGTLSGTEGEGKAFKAAIGVSKGEEFVAYAQTLTSSQIAVSPLFIEQVLAKSDSNLTADPGETLSYKLKYRNTTSLTIGPAVISVKIDSRAVDWGSISTSRGFFSSNDNTITWNSSGVSELASLGGGQEGELDFSLRLKEKMPVSGYADKNFTVVTTAQIDSPNVPLPLVGTQLKGENKTEVKVNSRLTLEVKGFFADNTFSNTGPLPPRVGQTTTYTIHLQLLNSTNDMAQGSLVVEAVLPTYVQWLGKIHPAGENIRYESSTGKVTWRIDKLPAGTGILSPVKQAIFQIALTPSLSQVGDSVDLVKSAKATAQDAFTLSFVASAEKTLRSDLPDDPSVGWDKARVTN